MTLFPRSSLRAGFLQGCRVIEVFSVLIKVLRLDSVTGFGRLLGLKPYIAHIVSLSSAGSILLFYLRWLEHGCWQTE